MMIVMVMVMMMMMYIKGDNFHMYVKVIRFIKYDDDDDDDRLANMRCLMFMELGKFQGA